MNKLLILFAIILFSCNNKQVKTGHNYHGFTDTVTFKYISPLPKSTLSYNPDFEYDGKIHNYYTFYVNIIDVREKDTVRHIAFYERIKDSAYLKGDIKLIFREISKGYDENFKLISSLYKQIDSLEAENFKLKNK